MTFMDDRSNQTPLMRAQAEAAAWIALLHSSERNAEIEAGLQRWIAADSLHAKAWEAATDIWSETAGLPRRIPAAPVVSTRARGPYFRPILAVAALCVVAVGAGFILRVMHDSVSTAVGEQRTLNLDDGTRVELNTDTRLYVKYDGDSRTVILDSGEAYFQVARERRPFVVIAGGRKIVALGTAFTVRHDDAASEDAVTVTLIEGRVAVTPMASPDATTPPAPTVLSPGQRLRARAHSRPAVETTSIDKATGWMRGQLIFDHTPLSEAAAEFSRYNKIKIRVESARAAAIPIGGIFRIGDSGSFARAVAASYDLRVVAQGDELVLEPTQSNSADGESPNP